MAFGGDSSYRPRPVAGRVAHYGALGVWLSVASVVAYGLNPVAVARTSALLMLTAIAACALVGATAMRSHDRRLCELCVTSLPLNPAQVAERYRLRFAVAHAFAIKPIALIYLIVVVGSDLILLPGSPLERLAWATVQSTMAYIVLAYSSHRRFQPWCPQCRGGDGERDHDADRGPVPLGNRSS